MRHTKYDIRNTKNERRATSDELYAGSALILAVVLTSLLAIVGVMFVMIARVDKISTSAIAENKTLNLAVETVIAKISLELVLDTPGAVDPNQEYYDYPKHTLDAGSDLTLGTFDDLTIEDPGPDLTFGTADDLTYYGIMDEPWLASLEPSLVDVTRAPAAVVSDIDLNRYGFAHISDVYGRLAYLFQDSYNGSQLDYWDSFGDRISFRNMRATIIDPTASIEGEGDRADADGDGVADSRWIELPNMNSSKGKPIYAAIRVIDNGGMLNVNTAYKFDPNETSRKRIDGSSQTQINLAVLSQRGANGTLDQAADKLQYVRCGSASNNISMYEDNVVWRYDRPNGTYTPFDISDELKLRNRYILNYNLMTSRIEEFWQNAYDGGLEVPRTRNSELTDPNGWFWKANNISWDVNEYDYRHISTTYNMDRIINPVGSELNNGKMVNVNKINPVVEPNVADLYSAIWAGLYDAGADVSDDPLAAQMAVNLKDFSDNDSNVTTVYDLAGNPHYGFERPCIFISELVYKSKPDVNDPNIIHRSYAIELRKRHPQGNIKNMDDWQVVINTLPNSPITVDLADNIGNFASDARRYRVIVFEDPCASLAEYVEFSDSPEDGETGVDPNVILKWDPSWMPNADSYDVYFDTNETNVREANNAPGLWLEFKGNQSGRTYDPYGPPPDGALAFNTTYYWRIDDVDANGNVIATGNPPWSFTTWETEPNVIYEIIEPGTIIFDVNSTIRLIRNFDGYDLVVDSVGGPLPLWLVEPVEAPVKGTSFQRDMAPYRFIKRLWDVNGLSMNNSTLGHWNNYSYPGKTEFIQVRFGNFNNVGEIGQVFREDVYKWPWSAASTEAEVRIDLADPAFRFQQLFKYLTVFDPAEHISDPNETRIKGRININTAPWYVISQLPWVSQKKNQPVNYELVQAIVAYRDNTVEGFRSIGELNNIINEPNSLGNIDYYGRDIIDQQCFPDLTVGKRTKVDGAADDFEERDLIFSRISDLVTVRSDVFTAYILVRIGADGPQKRVIAILDRSNVYSSTDKVKIVAVHPVPDPR